MTRKDYTRAAEMVAKLPAGPYRVAIIMFLCEFFRQDNPLFNTQRFEEACKKE